MNDASKHAIEQAADQLFKARKSGQPISPVRETLPSGDLDAAYAVQQINVARLSQEGRRRIGRKIGLTSRAVQTQLGVDQPDFGVLFDFMDCSDRKMLLSDLIAPRIEAEIAFRLARRIDRAGLSYEELIAHIKGVAAAVEIVDSAVERWDIGIVDTIADNASCGRFAVGDWQPYRHGAALPSAQMRLMLNGEEVSRGEGAATLGDPLNALAWLANVSAERGDPLEAGEVILAGALGPMTLLAVGTYEVTIDGFPLLSLEVAA